MLHINSITDIDRDYDLTFNKEGGTQTLRPHVFNATILSLSIWVLFTKESTGDIICLHRAE